MNGETIVLKFNTGIKEASEILRYAQDDKGSRVPHKRQRHIHVLHTTSRITFHVSRFRTTFHVSESESHDNYQEEPHN